MKKTIMPERPRSSLIITHADFKSKLNEIIIKGKKLYSAEIRTLSQIPLHEKNFNLWDEYNNEYFRSSFNNAENEYRQEYLDSGAMIGMKEVLRGANIDDPSYRMKILKQRLESKITALESLLGRADLFPSSIKGSILNNPEKNIWLNDNPTVFIIHGHDEEMKRNVQVFLSRGDLKDIVLHEQPDMNRTVIEKLIEEGSTANYVIALLSPDDVQEDGTLRARQNVILEIGYFIGKIGRNKVRLLMRDNTVIPSDLNGILYDNYDKNGAWRIKLAKEMLAVGIPVNIDKIISTF